MEALQFHLSLGLFTHTHLPLNVWTREYITEYKNEQWLLDRSVCRSNLPHLNTLLGPASLYIFISRTLPVQIPAVAIFGRTLAPAFSVDTAKANRSNETPVRKLLPATVGGTEEQVATLSQCHRKSVYKNSIHQSDCEQSHGNSLIMCDLFCGCHIKIERLLN